MRSPRADRYRSLQSVTAAPELTPFGPYPDAPAAIKGWLADACGKSSVSDHGQGDRRDEDLRSSVGEIYVRPRHDGSLRSIPLIPRTTSDSPLGGSSMPDAHAHTARIKD